MPVTTRHLLIAAALLSLTACGNTELTARGSVTARAGSLESPFIFDQPTRLEVPERDAALGLITGSCEMAKVADDTWGIVVEIRRGGTIDDNGLASVTIMQRTDAEPGTGRIEAELGTTSFTSSADSCAIEVEYAEPDSGMVGLLGDCGLQDAAGNEATISVDLDLIGCTVLE
ncbi:MAG: hypothetical protein H6719_04385 [Sandaracinaceae bacterium]|nr:hypothetical protein [Sandaracinaceae bacterium]